MNFKLFFKGKINGIIALVILTAILLYLSIFYSGGNVFKDLLFSMCVNFRGGVTLFCYFCLIFLAVIACSKYGKIRLGGKNAKTEFSTFSWLSCLFMAGCGIGIVFYCQEPILHLYSNPYMGNVSGKPENVAYSLTLFNWTINAWSQFAVLGIIIAYLYFNKGKELKLSSIFPESTPSIVKRAIDILMALGVIAGLTTSLGLGVTQMCRGFSYVFHTNISPYILMLFIAMVATWSVTTGLKKGVKWLSNLSLILIGVLLVVIVIIALVRLNINGFVGYISNGTWLLFRNFFSYNDFYNPTSNTWAANYPIFFDLWFAAWAAFVAVFVAKISKGRTIREFILGVVGVPTLFTILWFGIFGCIGLEFKDLIYKTMSSDVPTALFIFLQQIVGTAGYIILSASVLFIICMFFITSSDSGSFVVATLLSDNRKVSKGERMFWSLVQCIVAMILFACGGLALVQSVSVIMGIIVMALVFFGTFFFIYKIIGDSQTSK